MFFQFFHKLDLKRVLEGGPWAIGSHPLLVHHLQMGEIPHQVPLDKIQFWVQIYNLPIGSFSESVGRSPGNFIETFLEYDSSNRGAAWKSFMRIRVELNVNTPLKRGKKIRMGNGVSTMVNFKYERLQLFCFICGKLGHTESYCDSLFDSEDGSVTKGWGSFLKAPDRRSQVSTGDRWLWNGNTENLGGPIVEGNAPMEEEAAAGSSGEAQYCDPVVVADRGKSKIPGSAILSDRVTVDQDRRVESELVTGTLIHNPCFEYSNYYEEGGIDEVTLNELKKRKMAVRVHGDDMFDAEGNLMNCEITLAGNNDGDEHFLSADPGSGVCQE